MRETGLVDLYFYLSKKGFHESIVFQFRDELGKAQWFTIELVHTKGHKDVFDQVLLETRPES